jgi:hypothetical protein
MPRSKAKYDSAAVLELLDKEERGILARRMKLAGDNEDELRQAVAGLSITTLMSEVVELRLPFMRMFKEVMEFLASAGVRARSSARFVVLEDEQDLKLDFGAQMQGAIAESLERASLRRSRDEIDRRLHEVVQGVDSVIGSLRPMAVRRHTPQSEFYSRSADPGDRFLAERYKRLVHEYHFADRESLRKISAQLDETVNLCVKLSKAEKNPETAGYLRSLESLQHNTTQKLAGLNVAVSHEYPLRIQIRKQTTEAVLQKIRLLREILLAVSKFNTDVSGLVDFFNLEVWQHRWRLYELWTLAHLITTFVRADFEVDLSNRVTDGVWSLKFTKDADPVAILKGSSQALEVYYQLYSRGAARGNMPDIAIRFKDGGYIVVADPKHGLSYDRERISEVAQRYHEDFQALLTLVHNYYPMNYDAECVASHSNCLLLSDVHPDGEGLRKFDHALRQFLPFAWKQEPSIVVLFDTSSSTISSAEHLHHAFEKRLGALHDAPSPESVVVFFADTIREKRRLSGMDGNAVSKIKPDGQTNIRPALDLAFETLSKLPPPRFLWIFSDGEPSLNVDSVSKTVNDQRIYLEVYDSGSSAIENDLRRLADGTEKSLYQALSAEEHP